MSKSLSIFMTLLLASHSLQMTLSQDKPDLDTMASKLEEAFKDPPTVLGNYHSVVKVPPKFLQEEATQDQPSDEDKRLKLYDTVTILTDSFEQIMLGQNFPEVYHDRFKCLIFLGPNKADADNAIKLAMDEVWDYCYKPDPEMTLFNVMYKIVYAMLNNWTTCHPLWGTEKTERLLAYGFQLVSRIKEIMDHHDEEKAAEAAHATKEGRVDAQPEEGTELGNRLKDQVGDYGGMIKGFSELNKSIKSALSALENQEQALHGKKDQMETEDFYNHLRHLGNENITQMLAATSQYADFFCRSKEELFPHYAYTVKIWKDLLDAITEVTNDDKYP